MVAAGMDVARQNSTDSFQQWLQDYFHVSHSELEPWEQDASILQCSAVELAALLHNMEQPDTAGQQPADTASSKVSRRRYLTDICKYCLL